MGISVYLVCFLLLCRSSKRLLCYCEIFSSPRFLISRWQPPLIARPSLRYINLTSSRQFSLTRTRHAPARRRVDGPTSQLQKPKAATGLDTFKVDQTFCRIFFGSLLSSQKNLSMRMWPRSLGLSTVCQMIRIELIRPPYSNQIKSKSS